MLKILDVKDLTIEVSAYVVMTGIGNRWQFENNITIGVDWIDLLIPIGSGTTSEIASRIIEDEDLSSDYDKIQNLLIYSRDKVTFNILKVSLGYAF